MVLLSWGWNQNSQLGHGDSDVRVIPQSVAVFENSSIVQVVCGSRYTVALTKRGNVFSWGRGDDYQLGHAKGASLATVPRLIQTLEDVVIVQVAARGAHTLALSSSGQVYAWGRNDEGQLGVGSRTPCRVPTLVRSLVHEDVVVTQIACGRVHSLAVSADRKLYTWGCNDDGATGHDVDEPVLEPKLLEALDNVSQVSCGSRHTLVVVESSQQQQQSKRQYGLVNKLYAFGWGTYGQLGLDDRKTRKEPVEVVFPQLVQQSRRVQIKQISCGYRHSLAILEFSRESSSVDALESAYTALWAWGWNQYGQLGMNTGDSPYSLTPLLVTSLPYSVHSVAGGGRHTLAVVVRPSDGAKRAYAFGRNDDGQLGLGVTFSEQVKPARVRCFGVNIREVAAGWSHSIALVDEMEDTGDAENQKFEKSDIGASMSRSPSSQWLAEKKNLLQMQSGQDVHSKKPRMLSALKSRIESTFTAGNMDAGFGQFLNTLILLLNILSSLRFRVGLEQSTVVGKIVPGATLTVCLSNVIFGGWAEVLTIRAINKNTNEAGSFTALPHGISTVLFFAFTMLIMAPVFQKTGDAELAYRTGLASCFLLGVLELPCLFLVDKIRKVVPRAAMMSAMAGVSLTFIAMTFTVQIFSNPAVAILPLTIILVCYGSNVQLPHKIPAGLLALVLGSLVLWVARLLNIQLMDPASEGSQVENVQANDVQGSIFLPSSSLPEVLVALSDSRTWSSITVVIPLLIVNIVTNLSCLEGAEAVGDEYSTRWGLALDALITIIGALFGNPFPTCIYIGHSAFKSMGAGAEYSYLSAISVILLGITNGTSAVMRVVPEVAGVGVLMWIGIVVTAQAFDRDDEYIQESSASKSHAAAVALGLLPALAAWALQFIQAALPACGTVLSTPSSEVQVPFDKVMETLEMNGVYVYGLISLSRGYLLSSIFLSSMLVEIIDRKFRNAAGWMILAAALSFVGAVHSFELDAYGISSRYGFPSRTVGEFPLKYSFAYSMAAVVLLIFEIRESGHSVFSVISRLFRPCFRVFSDTKPVVLRFDKESAHFAKHRPADRSSSLNSNRSNEDSVDVPEIENLLSGKPKAGYNT